MVKVEIKTQTTYIVDLPIDSFDDITVDQMPIEASDEMLITLLSEKLDVGVDKIISVNPIK